MSQHDAPDAQMHLMTADQLRHELQAAYRAIVALGASIDTLTEERDAARADLARVAAVREAHNGLVTLVREVVRQYNTNDDDVDLNDDPIFDDAVMALYFWLRDAGDAVAYTAALAQPSEAT